MQFAELGSIDHLLMVDVFSLLTYMHILYIPEFVVTFALDTAMGGLSFDIRSSSSPSFLARSLHRVRTTTSDL